MKSFTSNARNTQRNTPDPRPTCARFCVVERFFTFMADCAWRRSVVVLCSVAILVLSSVKTSRAQESGASSAPSLQALVTQAQVWALSRDAFMREAARLRFVWVSDEQKCARSVATNLVFGGLRVWEAQVWFEDATPREVTLSLYNRGDAGGISKESFESMVGSINKTVSALAGQAAEPKELSKLAGVSKKCAVWVQKPFAYRLEWSNSRDLTAKQPFRPEYIRLRMLPSENKTAALSNEQHIDPFTAGRKKPERLPNGDIVLTGVPMVDQGQKGYCAVAATERVLRYYGTSIDQHELAQMANTREGTDPQSLIKAIRKITTALRIKFVVLEEFSVNDFLRLLNNYNSTARRRKQPALPELPESGMIDVLEYYRAMNLELLKETRLSNKAAPKIFHDKVVPQINNGMPVLWGVVLGIVKEPELKQEFGGHIRLIIGYNDKTSEILYSDTWGAGHELKRMALNDAFTITSTLYVIEPK